LLLVALQLEGEERGAALDLLARWAAPEVSVAADVAAWQAWFATAYPQLAPATLPEADAASLHKLPELVAILRSTAGEATRGAVVFEKALCVKCHHVLNKGEKFGPDLTKVMERLTLRELAESILHPSQQVSDQYATQQVLLNDGRILSGMVGETPSGYTVLTPGAEKITVLRDDVEEMKESPLSSMPTGLLNAFSAAEAADLVAYLRQAAAE
jgi:putative heme-binding domain-containing protein